jgi:hypothetical protein
MEFNYLLLSKLVVGEGKYDWSPLEALLNDIASRNCQTVVRIAMEYPGNKEGIPQYLVDAGLKVIAWNNTNNAPLPPAESRTPDYEDPRLRKMLRDFIQAFGAKYDGDPRIGFICIGLLGTWGEWHTFPRNDLWASKAVQAEVMDAYEAAFRKTKLLHRYPAKEGHYAQADNSARRMGYHDDSFNWATLDTGRKEDDWFFVPALKAAGVLDKWKTQPIGGEIRPETWGKIFDADHGNPQIQDFGLCVQETHASWMLDTGMFQEAPSDFRKSRATRNVRRMGYEFTVQAATLALSGQSLNVKAELRNLGVAPFYYDWPVEFGMLNSSGKLVKTARGSSHITDILPKQAPTVWNETIVLNEVAKGKYKVLVRVVNPLPQGKPLRFANETQGKDLAGWLTLGEFVL